MSDILTADSYKRDWGEWYVLERGRGYKVKRLVIHKGCAISNQYHNYRDEIWTIVEGSAEVTLDGSIIYLHKGQTLKIPRKSAHKVKCISDEALIAIEVQLGEITEENDIIRLD